mmetsp:Transcript_77508/g.121983  ORF Transcript_77508/g.121983 Transcript_77508/m.121983 type:complete len:112 (+) Transcript_77508:198-533(+)
MKIEEGAIQQKLDTRCTSAWQPSMAKERHKINTFRAKLRGMSSKEVNNMPEKGIYYSSIGLTRLLFVSCLTGAHQCRLQFPHRHKRLPSGCPWASSKKAEAGRLVLVLALE